MGYKDQLEKYLEELGSLRLEKIGDVLELVNENFAFSDPFNNTIGKGPYQKVLEATLKDSLDMKFEIIKIIREEALAFLTWDFSFLPANRILGSNRITIHGMSEIKISDTGLISYHKDYWDVAATVYQRVPILGSVLNILRKRVAVSD